MKSLIFVDEKHPKKVYCRFVAEATWPCIICFVFSWFLLHLFLMAFVGCLLFLPAILLLFLRIHFVV